MPRDTKRLYLDWNATAPMLPAARDAAMAAFLAGGNASSVHAEGRAARATVETARRKIASRFGVAPDAVTFTSGGTEANVMALCPGVARPGAAAVERLIVSAVEHPAVLAGGRFEPDDITIVPVDDNGLLDLSVLEEAIKSDPRTPLVSVMAANNETGVRQPLKEIAALARGAGGTFHTDAVQAFGRVADEEIVGDIISISGHKLGAPLGVGVLVRRCGTTVPTLIRGGGQERGARAGTENVAAIAGLLAALQSPAAQAPSWQQTSVARDGFEASLSAVLPDARIFGTGAPRLPNTCLFAPGKTPAEIALIALDMAGVSLSSGSACSSGTVAASHVLSAMGIEDGVAKGALRVSVGPDGADVAFEQFLMALREVIVPLEARSIS